MSRSLLLVALFTSLVLAVCAHASVALGQPRRGGTDASEARELFVRGAALADQEQWADALDLFRRSRALVDRPSTAFNMGQALVRLGRPVEALRALEDYLRMSDPHRDAALRTHAEHLISEARAAMSVLVLQRSPLSATVRVDGESIEVTGPASEIHLDPGPHNIDVEAPGYRSRHERLSLLRGSRETLEIRLEPQGVQPPPAQVSSPSAIAAPSREPGPQGSGPSVHPARAGERHAETSAGTSVPPGVSAPTPPLLSASSLSRERMQDRPAPSGLRRLVRSPWLWIIAGAVVAGTVVAIVLATSGQDAASGGSTGIVMEGIVGP